MEKTHTFKLTIAEMRMIRNALEYEAERRENQKLAKVEEHNALANFFSRRIEDTFNK